MKVSRKTWIWYLTFPFAHNNYTTIWDTVYYPKGSYPSGATMRHEFIHSNQQRKWTIVGLPFWLWLYVVGFPLGLPILINPWRRMWEMQAYTEGSGYSPDRAKRILRSYRYGWLFL